MDEKILTKANELNEQIRQIGYFVKNMDEDNAYTIYDQYMFPKELKDLLRPVLKEYQEKLFLQLKNL